VRWPDIFTPRQVGDGASEFEDAVVGAGRELELVHGSLHQGTAGIVELAKQAHFGRVHIGIAQNLVFGFNFSSLVFCSQESRPLNIARRFYPLAHDRLRFTQALFAELVIFYPRHLDVDVDTVEQWTGNALLVFGHHPRRTRARFQRVAVVTARAWVHGCDQLEIGGER